MDQQKTILVVDDEIKITEIVKSYLEKDGYGVVCAYDGRDALAA
ncbi:MAG TPA: DNA-binding response regulator, partial [Ruminococcaceae bacterium]|nr:DNA-binding response regulator [Oscillospiraceae bacterium]